VTMSTIRRDDRNARAAALAACLVGCEKERSKTAARPRGNALPMASAPPEIPSAQPRPSRGSAGPPRARRLRGQGHLRDPCKATGKKRIHGRLVDKKIGDKGRPFKIINQSKLEILYGKDRRLLLDRRASRSTFPFGEKMRRRVTAQATSSPGPVKRARRCS